MASAPTKRLSYATRHVWQPPACLSYFSSSWSSCRSCSVTVYSASCGNFSRSSLGVRSFELVLALVSGSRRTYVPSARINRPAHSSPFHFGSPDSLFLNGSLRLRSSAQGAACDFGDRAKSRPKTQRMPLGLARTSGPKNRIPSLALQLQANVLPLIAVADIASLSQKAKSTTCVLTPRCSSKTASPDTEPNITHLRSCLTKQPWTRQSNASHASHPSSPDTMPNITHLRSWLVKQPWTG